MAKEVLSRKEEFIVEWLDNLNASPCGETKWFNYSNYISSYKMACALEKRHNEEWPYLKTRIVRKITVEEVM